MKHLLNPICTIPFLAGAMTSLRAAAGLLAVVAALLMGMGYSQNPDQAAFSYLVAFLFLLSLAVGALFWILLHYLTAAVWSVVLRRLTEHLASLIIPSAVLFIPLLLGMQILFRWSVHRGRSRREPGRQIGISECDVLPRSSESCISWSGSRCCFISAAHRFDRISRRKEAAWLRCENSALSACCSWH